MNIKGLAVTAALSALVVVGVACGNGEAATTPQLQQPTSPAAPAGTSAAQPTPGLPSVEPSSAGTVAPGTPREEPGPSSSLPPNAPVRELPSTLGAPVAGAGMGVSVAGLQTSQAAYSQAGIWVSGLGKISLEPDMAVVSIGVEAQAQTVTVARDQAATAMAAIVAAVKARGLTDLDIQTRSFNIYPRYDYIERRQVFVGYTVRNDASIKIRDLDNVGPIIDDVANAGGDATRINGISFTVEDTSPFMAELREKAVNNALGKAAHFAQLVGVSVGPLVYISEGGSRTPVVSSGAARGIAMEAAIAPDTQISGGELQLTMTVQAVFDIERP